MIAQGKAKRRPGLTAPKNFQALQGRHNLATRDSNGWRSYAFEELVELRQLTLPVLFRPFSGLRCFWDLAPRASLRLPWAITSRAFSPDLGHGGKLVPPGPLGTLLAFTE